jgi:hypothetical protein
VIPVAKITPAGVHAVVKSGWEFKRQRITHDWVDGAKDVAANWNADWVDDTSDPMWKQLMPDNQDKIYDNDSPNIARVRGFQNTGESYSNFRQWIEWHGHKCSHYGKWYWRGRWDMTAAPQVTLKDVGTGNVALPAASFFRP